MAYYEHIKGRKYRLVERDPSAIGRKRLSQTVTVPEEVGNSERKIEQWLNLELAKYAEKVQAGELVKTEKLTLAQFVPKWKKGYADQNMGEYTRRNYISIIDAYLIPKFGNVRLEQLKPLHLVTFFAELTKKDGSQMATNTKLNIYKTTKSIFDAAHKWRLIARNPMDGVDRPTADKSEKREIRKRKKAYTRDESETVIIALYSMPDRWRLYYTGVILGGFRRGEMLALEWTEVDQEECGLHIVKQITFDEDGKAIEGELKTEESESFVPMPTWYMEELKQFRKTWAKEKLNCPNWLGGDKQYIFHSGDGQYYYPNTPSLTWRRFLTKNKLPAVRLHDLRHTTAMLLRESGADLKTMQERLRHTKIGTTADIYTHESKLVSRDAADRLESLNPHLKKSAPKTAPRTVE